MAILTCGNDILSNTWRFTLASASAVEALWAVQERKKLNIWIEEQRAIAFTRIAANIGPAAGARDGIVIASPSAGTHLSEPDYYVSFPRLTELTL
jgi:hypothetical protein